jgi:hypothetical protein
MVVLKNATIVIFLFKVDRTPIIGVLSTCLILNRQKIIKTAKFCQETIELMFFCAFPKKKM